MSKTFKTILIISVLIMAPIILLVLNYDFQNYFQVYFLLIYYFIIYLFVFFKITKKSDSILSFLIKCTKSILIPLFAASLVAIYASGNAIITLLIYLIIFILYSKKFYKLSLFVNIILSMYIVRPTLYLLHNSSGLAGLMLIPMIAFSGASIVLCILIILELINKNRQDKLNSQQIINNQNN